MNGCLSLLFPRCPVINLQPVMEIGTPGDPGWRRAELIGWIDPIDSVVIFVLADID